LKFHEPTKERLFAGIAERMRVEEQLRAANRTLRPSIGATRRSFAPQRRSTS